MAFNWIGIWLKLGVVVKVVAILVILCFPITGSRSIGGNLGSGSSSGGGLLVTFDPPPTDNTPESQPSSGDEELSVSTDSSGSGGTSDGGFRSNDSSSSNSNSSSGSSSSTSATSSINNPCALVSMSLLDEKDGKLMSYEEKSLLSISHQSFDVSHGIVPNILYKGKISFYSIIQYALVLCDDFLLSLITLHNKP